jgi:hypothetical protein
VVLLCYAKNPHQVRDWSNILFLVVDVIFVTFLTVYGTRALFSPVGLYCRDNNDPNTFKWWVVSLCCLVINWMYDLLLLVGLTSLPLIIIFWCIYRMQMRQF